MILLLASGALHGLESDPEHVPEADTGDPELANQGDVDDLLSGLDFEVPSKSEGNSSEENEKISEYQQKKANGKFLITKLKSASSIIDDITHNMQVVLFVENDKAALENEDLPQKENRKKLIDLLKQNREHEDVRTTAFYFADCSFLENLCDEMSIDPKTNQVALISKFVSTPIVLDESDLVDRIWGKITQSLTTLPDIDSLNRMIEENNGVNVLLFNTTPEAGEEVRSRQRERAMKLVRKCKTDCFDRAEFIELVSKDDFLQKSENAGKTFLIRKGEFLETPFRMDGTGDSQTQKALTMINNEGMHHILQNNNENYFKIYQNDMKAIVTMVLNTTDPVRKQALLSDFEEAALQHRRDRKDFLDRYTFVVTDLNETDKEYRELLLEVTGELSSDAEVFVFSRGNHMDSYENYNLKENMDSVEKFFDSLEDRIAEYERLTQKKQELQAQANETGNETQLNELESESLEFGELYAETWKTLRDMPRPDQDARDALSVRNILGFLYANDMEVLQQFFYKSEAEDREHNDKYLKTGLLQVTGKNFDRLIFDINDPSESFPEIKHNFILVVCRNSDESETEGCMRMGEMLHFLRQNFPKEDSEIRIGIMDHLRNDHRVIERFNIESFPVLIFFGKSDLKRRGKIFRGKLVVEKVINWLDRKFMDNEGTEMELTDEHYKHLLVLTARTKE